MSAPLSGGCSVTHVSSSSASGALGATNQRDQRLQFFGSSDYFAIDINPEHQASHHGLSLIEVHTNPLSIYALPLGRLRLKRLQI